LLIGLLLIKFSPRLLGGQIFSLYIFGYCAGRLVFEALRIDEANLIFGIRINIFVAFIVGSLAVLSFRRFAKQAR
jgi:prolipoprotein diacylglyceryltransferase